MPTLLLLDGGKLAMYAGDHNPPHFHLLGPDFQEVYAIRGLGLLRRRGRAPAALRRRALAWAAEHETMLLAKWAELNEQDDSTRRSKRTED